MNSMNNWQNKTLKLLSISAFPLLATTVLTTPAKASSIDVACKAEGSTPTIVASVTEEGTAKEATILQFLPEYFSPDDATNQCQTTASKLHELYNTDSVSYLASDTLSDGQSVVCAVTRRGSGCDSYSSEVLFTLAQGTDPSLALYDMLDNSIKQTHPRPDSRTVSRIYTDITPSVWNLTAGRKWWPF